MASSRRIRRLPQPRSTPGSGSAFAAASESNAIMFPQLLPPGTFPVFPPGFTFNFSAPAPSPIADKTGQSAEAALLAAFLELSTAAEAYEEEMTVSITDPVAAIGDVYDIESSDEGSWASADEAGEVEVKSEEDKKDPINLTDLPADVLRDIFWFASGDSIACMVLCRALYPIALEAAERRAWLLEPRELLQYERHTRQHPAAGLRCLDISLGCRSQLDHGAHDAPEGHYALLPLLLSRCPNLRFLSVSGSAPGYIASTALALTTAVHLDCLELAMSTPNLAALLSFREDDGWPPRLSASLTEVALYTPHHCSYPFSLSEPCVYLPPTLRSLFLNELIFDGDASFANLVVGMTSLCSLHLESVDGVSGPCLRETVLSRKATMECIGFAAQGCVHGDDTVTDSHQGWLDGPTLQQLTSLKMLCIDRMALNRSSWSSLPPSLRAIIVQDDLGDDASPFMLALAATPSITYATFAATESMSADTLQCFQRFVELQNVQPFSKGELDPALDLLYTFISPYFWQSDEDEDDEEDENL